jgi:hypothetical protein
MKSLKYWTIDGFDIATYKWSIKERINKEIMGNGSDKGNCYYSFNELGFRGDSPKKNGIRIMSVGCSHTEGINVHNHQTWSYQLTRMIPNGVDLNLGINGRSNDYIARTIMTWTEKLKPSLVLVMYTYPNKREYYTENAELEPYHSNPWGYFDEDMDGRKTWANIISAENDEQDYINWYKNHQLITYYLQSKGIPFIWNGTFLKTDFTDENRFDGNYPYFDDNTIHATDYENAEYAKNLFNHIKENFEI